jgi:hypothetical protein
MTVKIKLPNFDNQSDKGYKILDIGSALTSPEQGKKNERRAILEEDKNVGEGERGVATMFIDPKRDRVGWTKIIETRTKKCPECSMSLKKDDSPLRKFCDGCGKKGANWTCATDGCDYDLCTTCYDSIE